MRFLAIAIVLAACSSPSKPPTPTPVEPTPVEPTADAAAVDPQPAAIDAGPAPVAIDAAPALAADGASCLRAEECASGVCEGEGCFDEKPGTCAPAQRGCTKDLRSYCGCDGVTFKTSGSCPKRRYEAKGACPTGTKRKAGEFCLKAGDCASKTCEGMGCDDTHPGRCVETKRACTADVVQYCTCDGKTTTGSGSCPGVRYSRRGTCDEDD